MQIYQAAGVSEASNRKISTIIFFKKFLYAQLFFYKTLMENCFQQFSFTVSQAILQLAAGILKSFKSGKCFQGIFLNSAAQTTPVLKNYSYNLV